MAFMALSPPKKSVRSLPRSLLTMPAGLLWPLPKSAAAWITLPSRSCACRPTEKPNGGFMIGTQIENYLIQAQLGEGGMGVVYRALETNLDRTVAIKVLNADLARDPSIVERFRSEARAQANLNHTNIATLYAFLVFQGNPVMVMEYVEGETFQQMVHRRGPLPAEEAIPLFRQALLGISAAHRMGIVH